MSREVIGDDMNRAPRRLMSHQVLQESDKLGAGMALRSLAGDFSSADLQSGEKRERTMPVIFKAVAFGPTRRSGSTGSSRSSAWIALFVHANTAAWAGGLR